MGEAILVGGRTGAVEQKIYKWKQYECNVTTTYYWNRWNAGSTTTYYWNKYYCSTTYKWEKWTSDWGWSLSGEYSSSRSLYYDASGRYSMSGYIDYYKSKPYVSNGSVVASSGSGNYWRKSEGVWDTSWYDASYWYFADYPTTVISGVTKMEGRGVQVWDGDVQKTVINVWVTGNRWMAFRLGYIKGSTNYGTVESTDPNAYPNGGYNTSDKFWYSPYTTSVNRGSYYGQVSSTSSGAYPSPGVSGSFWYESAGSNTQWYKGSTEYPQVSSTNAGAYPNNDRSGSYWYIYDRFETTYSMGNYTGDRLSTDRDRFPDDGYSDGYWYVFSGEA